MSSLLQFSGEIRKNPKTRRGEVGLEFIRRDIDRPFKEMDLDPKVPCTICNEEHPQIGVAYRSPVGMMGHWVIFRYLGEEHAPDLSVPIDVLEWPKGTTILDPEENSKS